MIFASISSLSKIPSSKASFTAAKSLIGAAGAKRMSLPANSAITEGLSDLRVVAPFIAKASVKHSPPESELFLQQVGDDGTGHGDRLIACLVQRRDIQVSGHHAGIAVIDITFERQQLHTVQACPVMMNGRQRIMGIFGGIAMSRGNAWRQTGCPALPAHGHTQALCRPPPQDSRRRSGGRSPGCRYCC